MQVFCTVGLLLLLIPWFLLKRQTLPNTLRGATYFHFLPSFKSFWPILKRIIKYVLSWNSLMSSLLHQGISLLVFYLLMFINLRSIFLSYRLELYLSFRSIFFFRSDSSNIAATHFSNVTLYNEINSWEHLLGEIICFNGINWKPNQRASSWLSFGGAGIPAILKECRIELVLPRRHGSHRCRPWWHDGYYIWGFWLFDFSIQSTPSPLIWSILRNQEEARNSALVGAIGPLSVLTVQSGLPFFSLAPHYAFRHASLLPLSGNQIYGWVPFYLWQPYRIFQWVK